MPLGWTSPCLLQWKAPIPPWNPCFFQSKILQGSSAARPAGGLPFISSRYPGLFSPGGWTSFPKLLYISPVLGIASGSKNLLRDQAPEESAQHIFLPCCLAWPDPEQQSDVSTPQSIGPSFPSYLCLLGKMISSALLCFPLSPIACSVLCPFCLFPLLIFLHWSDALEIQQEQSVPCNIQLHLIFLHETLTWNAKPSERRPALLTLDRGFSTGFNSCRISSLLKGEQCPG